MGKIRDKISEDLKASMLAKDAVKTSVLRMIKAEVLKAEITKEVDDAGFIQILKTMKGQREESIREFEKANRTDLLEKEKQELAVLVTYLPKELPPEELEKIIDQAIAEVGAKDIKAMGKVIKAAMSISAGRADGKLLSEMVKSKLTK